MIQCQKPDLIFLQEVTVSSETLAEFVRKYGYTAVSNIDIRDDKTLGTAVVWRLGVPVQTVNEIELCRIQEVIVGTQPFLNIYAPAGKNYQGGRRQFFGQNVFRAIGNRNNVILAGDFNCILKEIDTEGNFQDKKCLVLMDLVNTYNLSDVFRQMHPLSREYTWHRPNCFASRLDRIYFPQELVPGIQTISHLVSLSDHHSVKCEFLLNVASSQLPPKRPAPYWK